MGPQSKSDYLRLIVEGKNKWRPLTAEEKAWGFLGWHERGYLPHCDYSGLVQLVTFRLWDSMPAERRAEWEKLLLIEDDHEKRAKLEAYLDLGFGECYLRNPALGELMQKALFHFDGARYEMLAWVAMPNHVHVLVKVWQIPLAKLSQSWKSFVARQANAILHREGPFWEPEYWDTFMRNEEQERKATDYIHSNPVRARLCSSAADWPFSSARLHAAQSSSSARF